METIIFLFVSLLILGVGIWLGSKKSEDKIYEPLPLLPKFFKAIGLTWTIISMVLITYCDAKNEEIWKIIFGHSVNLGLMLICFSKDKIEDELTNTIRLRSFYTSVIAGFSTFVIFSFANYLLCDENDDYTARHLMTVILFVYAFGYSSLKRKVRS